MEKSIKKRAQCSIRAVTLLCEASVWVCVKVLRAPWVRAASSALSARGLLKRNGSLAESALEAARTQGYFQRALGKRLIEKK